MTLGRGINRAINLVVVVALIAFTLYDLMLTVFLHDRFERLYADRLDSWVSVGGPKDSINAGLVSPCEKLTLINAGPVGLLKLFFNQAEYSFRVDVCVSIAANRVYPQPNLADPKMVSAVCGDQLFKRMCQRAGLESKD